jgi:hypothetical protein
MAERKQYLAEYNNHVIQVNALFTYQAKVRARDKFNSDYGIKSRATDIKVKEQ